MVGGEERGSRKVGVGGWVLLLRMGNRMRRSGRIDAVSEPRVSA